MDDDGETNEKVYDVAWSDGREPGADGKLPPIGSTVDVENATWTIMIGGAAERSILQAEFSRRYVAPMSERVTEVAGVAVTE